MTILIENVWLEGERKNIYVDGNRIGSLCSDGSRDGEVIDGSNMAAIPGLINTHTHSAMTLFRGFGDDMLLHEWLEEKIWPVEVKLTEEDVYWGSKLACLEMIKSGTTCFNDQYWFMKGTARAVDDMGLRAFLAEAFIDLFDEEKADESRKKTMDFVEYVESMGNDRIKAALGPHSLYTVSEESLRWFREYSDERDLLIHFHLAETEKESRDCMEKHGKYPVEYLQDIGFLCDRLIAAHCVWLSREEMEVLARYGVKVSHNPVSNMKLSVGSFFNYRDLKASGVVVSLGTDGCASNNNLDLLEEMKFAAVGQKAFSNDPTALPAKKAFKMATLGGASSLRIKAGKIEEGKLADIVLVDLKKAALTPQHNLISNLVYSANGSCVDTVICNGRILMREGRVEGEEEILENAGEVALDVVSRT
ncbi:MAG: hypothetical protein B6U72_00200 [Candidatus Altiarchaeales archaeon ex4484_2]|nr:MAG: hypothetical protein B6U72_00200 [Candidatus Altiarchaeales archaeon ex4484_2]